MLSTKTLQCLDDLCTQSHRAYPEGGITWTYIEAASQAHGRFADRRRTPPAGALDIVQLGAWIETALGGSRQATERSIGTARELIGLLEADLGIDAFLWNFDECDYDMTAVLHMMRASDNRYFALELWWSVD